MRPLFCHEIIALLPARKRDTLALSGHGCAISLIMELCSYAASGAFATCGWLFTPSLPEASICFFPTRTFVRNEERGGVPASWRSNINMTRHNRPSRIKHTAIYEQWRSHACRLTNDIKRVCQSPTVRLDNRVHFPPGKKKYRKTPTPLARSGKLVPTSPGSVRGNRDGTTGALTNGYVQYRKCTTSSD